MEKLKVLVGCEESQAVCKAFRELGHEAYSCDLKPCSGGHPEYHFQFDVLRAIEGGVLKTQSGDKVYVQKWDLAIFHPDCTYLTCSAEWAYKEGPYHQKIRQGTLVGKERIEARKKAALFFMRLYNANNITFVAVENPVGVISSYFRKPDQTIQPYMFGNDASKATCLWLKGLPKLVADKDYFVTPRTVCTKCKTHQTMRTHVEISLRDGCIKCGSKTLPRWGNQTDGGQNNLSPTKDRAEKRSVTYPGIAMGMARQWSAYILKAVYGKA